MCGIVGWANLKSNSSPNYMDEMLLRAMCAKIKHRGPDSEGVFLSESVALGMRRLSIIDLETGGQPVFNEDRAISVVMNGEIYNFQELRKELEQRGHKFLSRTDAKVLPYLYEEHGARMVEKLNGMFAFALWDSRRKKLFMERDRSGEKPLYLAEDILTKVDRASMATSLEVRSPFLDPRIAEFSASLPKDYKLNCKTAKFAFGNTGKFILKKSVAPLLPHSVTNRKK